MDLESDESYRGRLPRPAVLRGGVRDVLLALILLAMLALPSAASAKRSSGPSADQGSGPVAQFTLSASNGYKITVSGSIAGPSGKSAVTLSAERQHLSTAQQNLSSVQYTAPGRVTPKGVEASFGRLGALSVRFRPSGKVERIGLPKKCGGPIEARLGTFVGTIRLRGERGYTKVDADQAKGGIGDWLAISLHSLPDHGHRIVFCGPSNSGETEAPQEPLLYAENRAHKITFIAISASSPSSQQPPMSLFSANTSERRGRIAITRSVSATGSASDFIFDNALSTATVTPPAPFVGIATFQRSADGTTGWTGSLSVSFPGQGRVRLAGPSFTGRLETPGGS